MDNNMVDVASRGALMDKTPTTSRHLISNMVSNTQQFRTRGGAITSRVVSEVGAFDNLRLENQQTELTSLVRQLIFCQHQQNTYLHPFDPEIEKTLNWIRKSENMHIGHNSSSSVSSIIETDDFEMKPDFAENPL
ncbi:hypothetical protein CR513_58359, partial [Mucuna pruriens]